MESKIYRGLAEAYSEVYAPQKEFQLWVNSLLDEGYDLSDYTWEDMYEAYIEELTNPINDLWSNRGKIASAAKGAVSGVNRAATAANKGIGSSFRNTASAVKGAVTSAPARAAASGFGSGGLLGAVSGAVQSSRQQKPAKPTSTSTPTNTRKPLDPGRFERERERLKNVGNPPTTTTPATKPVVTSAPRPAAAPASKPSPTTTPKPPSGSGYKKDTSITDMIGRSQIRQGAPINTGNKSSDIRSMAARGTASGGLPTSPTSKPAPARPMGSRKPGSIVSGLDMFDLVKGYLLDEGYADTEEAAIKIMANMSEEWRDSILSEADSLAAMQARREKRLKAQRKREGTTVTGRDFGRDDRLTSDQQKARRDAEYKEGTKK
jgi:hypothetical protein